MFLTKKKILRSRSNNLISMASICSSIFNCVHPSNGSSSSSFLFLGLVSKNFSVNRLEVKVGEIHCLVMMIHRPSKKNFKTLIVLNKLKIRELFRLYEILYDLFTFRIGLQKSSLDLFILLNDGHLYRPQHLFKFLDLFLGFVSLIHGFNQIFPQF